MVRLGIIATGDDFLDASKLGRTDHGHMPTGILISPPGVADNAGIVWISEHMVEELSGNQAASVGEHTPSAKQTQDVCFRVRTSGEHLPGLSDWLKTEGIGLVRLGLLPDLRGKVSERRLPGPDPFAQTLLHSLDAAKGSDIVIELGEAGQNRLKKFAVRIGLNGLGDRGDLHSELLQSRLDHVVILDVPGKPVDLPDKKDLNVPALVFAVGQKFEQLSTVGELGRFAFLDERLGDGEIVSIRMIATG
ncbi:MAG: hypothetical protein Q7S43_01760 [bacterium]|nr:hypothetical protein [bacterium]